MYRGVFRLARAIVPALAATFLLSGCATLSGYPAPAALGAGKHGSIKDDLLPAVPVAEPKRTQIKTASVAPPRPPQQSSRAKRSDLPGCVTGSECMVQLKAMISDPNRSWIGRTQGPAEYANGTRLFAYRALQSQLTCPELNLALNELTAAAQTFRAPTPGVTAVQASRVLALNSDIERELRAELTNRCRS